MDRKLPMKMKSSFLHAVLLIIGLIVSCETFSQQYTTIGTGTSVTSSSGTTATGISPFGTYYHDDRTQMLYLKTELNAAGISGGDVLSVGFEVTNVAQAMNGFTIKMKNTTSTSLTSYVTNLTTVYTSGSQTLTVGWNDFTLPVPFSWNGTDNIVVQICFDNSSYTLNSTVKYSSTSFTSTRSSFCDSCAPGCSNTSSQYSYSSRANTRFKFTPPFANSAGIVKIDTPFMPSCTLDTMLYVRVRNSGTDSLTSAVINWKVNGVLKTPKNWSGSLASNATDTIPFHVGNYNFNDFDTLTVWTTMPNNVVDSNNLDDTLTVVLHKALQGTYTLGATNSDYNSFNNFLADVEQYGICGPVIVNVMDGTYNEQIEIKEYPSSNSVNTVTFKSNSGDSTAVILTYAGTSSSDNYTVKFKKARYFTFKGITIQNLGGQNGYTRAVVFEDEADNNKVENCVVEVSPANGSFSSNRACVYGSGKGLDYNSIVGSVIKNGSYGIYYSGHWSAYALNFTVKNTKIIRHFVGGIYLRYMNKPNVSENHFLSGNYNSAYRKAIEIDNSKSGDLLNNFIDTDSTNAYGYGIDIGSSAGTLSNFINITGNRIKYRQNGILISSSSLARISNNSILSWYNANSFSPALRLNGGSSYQVFNNNLVNNVGEYAMYAASAGVIDFSNHNNFYSNGTNILYAGSIYTSLAAFTAATQFDSMSLNVANTLMDTINLRECNDSLNAKGMPNPGSLKDFQGDVRDVNTPDIGADEFLPISTFTLGPDKVLCTGDTVKLEMTFFDTVIWLPNDTSKIRTVTSPGSYIVNVSGACGSAMDTIVILPQPTSQLSSTLNLCDGETKTLKPGISGGQYSWSGGSTADSLNVSSPGVYKVTIHDPHSCITKDSITVTQSPVVNLPDTTIYICEGNSITLDATIAGTYLWNDSSSSTTQTLLVNTSGDYSVTVTDIHNCISKDTAKVIKVLNPIATFDITQNNYGNVFVNNTSQNGTSYLWDFGHGTPQNIKDPLVHQYPYVTSNKDYTIKLVVTNRCGSDSISKKITVNSLVGVEDLNSSTSINLYPNPAKEQVTLAIQSKENVQGSVELLNVSGQVIINENLGEFTGKSTSTINLSGVKTGVYFVRVTLSGKQVVYKLIRQ